MVEKRHEARLASCEAVVHLLGGPFVTTRGCRLEVPEGSKRLLAFLALRRGRVERACAAGALWPHGDDHRASGNLRSALWRLRTANIDVFDTDKWSVSLRKDVAVDVHEIADCASRLIDDVAYPEDLEMTSAMTSALDLLPGCYDDWAIVERERLRQRILHGLETLSRQLAASGRFASAVEAAMAAVEVEPLRESAQRVLFEAHIGEANWVEARRGFLTYRSLVRRELGIEPSAELARLVGLGLSSARRPTVGAPGALRRAG
jgi:DNA-binding SARP family transcriptional activator